MRNLAIASTHVHTPTPEVDLTNGAFDQFAAGVRGSFLSQTQGGQQLFQTDIDGDKLFDIYINNLPLSQRQHHTCNCCRQFFRRVGGLVLVNRDGTTHSAMWGRITMAIPALYSQALTQLRVAVEKATVTAPFFSSERAFGNERTGFWTHFAVPNTNVFKPTTLSADEQVALKKEHFGTLARGLDDYSLAVVEKAVALLAGEALWRGEKVLGAAQFLFNVHTNLKGVRSAAKRRNIIWAAIANAPAGFCTPRSGMIGTLLDDLKAGLSLTDVKLKFAAKMAPDKYQRPQVAASAGNIAQGEAIIARMGLAPALRRRWAGAHEARPIWAPRTVRKTPAKAAGVFAGLDPRGSTRQSPAGLAMSGGRMTWTKFARTVLPTAAKVSLQMTPGVGSYGALVTEAVPGAPQLFQWDGPLSWYLYVNGSTPSSWSLPASGLVPVVGVAPKPGGHLDHNGEGVMLMLQGARDTRNPGLALFPETLRGELHPVRKTIEQFSTSKRLEAGPAGQLAQGLILTAGAKAMSLELVVETAAGMTRYRIDRWD